MGKKKKKMQKQKKQEMGGRWRSEGARFFFSLPGFSAAPLQEQPQSPILLLHHLVASVSADACL
jgi:hypothetical protein